MGALFISPVRYHHFDINRNRCFRVGGSALRMRIDHPAGMTIEILGRKVFPPLTPAAACLTFLSWTLGRTQWLPGGSQVDIQSVRYLSSIRRGPKGPAFLASAGPDGHSSLHHGEIRPGPVKALKGEGRSSGVCRRIGAAFIVDNIFDNKIRTM